MADDIRGCGKPSSRESFPHGAQAVDPTLCLISPGVGNQNSTSLSISMLRSNMDSSEFWNTEFAARGVLWCLVFWDNIPNASTLRHLPILPPLALLPTATL